MLLSCSLVIWQITVYFVGQLGERMTSYNYKNKNELSYYTPNTHNGEYIKLTDSVYMEWSLNPVIIVIIILLSSRDLLDFFSL